LKDATALPAGRALEVRVADAAGTPVASAEVTARYAPGDDPESQDAGVLSTAARTDADGRARVAVPTDRPVDLRVLAKGSAPAGLRVAPDAPTATDVTVEPGLSLTVRVEDARGAAVADARVLCVARAGTSEVRIEARTGRDGTATLPPVGAGRVEVLAHATGFAWGGAVAEAKAASEPVRIVLPAGERLHLVVEDPWGVPLDGVRVESAPRPSPAGQSPDPSDPDAAPWRTDAHGVLEVLDQPVREVTLFLHKDGYESETLRGVVPGDATWYATLSPSKP
jgi:hypothetical protein